MVSSGDTDMEEYRSRIDYISEIVESSPSNSFRMPTATEEQSFEEVLKRVVHVLSSNVCSSVEGTPNSSCMWDSGTTRDRKRCLTKILSQLRWMERERLYSPPAENEIGYYLLVKKYVRSILGFFSDVEALKDLRIGGPFVCLTQLDFLYPAEMLAEFNQHLADFSQVLLKKGVNDGFTLKPIMSVEHTSNIAPSIHGSKEKSYVFYMHKLSLAFIDLRCSEFALLPPSEDEKTSYVHVLELDSVSRPLIEDDQMRIYSDVLNRIFLERVRQETKDIMRHCANLKSWILENLSLTECWESIIEIFDAHRFENHDSDRNLVELRKALAKKCTKFSDEDLPNYISRLDCCRAIAENMLVHTICCLEHISYALHMFPSDEVEDAWEFLHALTLLKRVSPEHALSKKSQDEKVLVLRDIIEDLKRIGDSNVKLDEEEMALVQMIWGFVASSTHFFVSALAYEQQRYLTEHIELLDVVMLRLRRSLRKKKRFDKDAMENMYRLLTKDLSDFTFILDEYKKVLIGR